VVSVERKLGYPLINVERGREYRIAGMPVDGYYEVESSNETLCYNFMVVFDTVPHPNCYQINYERKLTSGVTRKYNRYEQTLAMT